MLQSLLPSPEQDEVGAATKLCSISMSVLNAPLQPLFTVQVKAQKTEAAQQLQCTVMPPGPLRITVCSGGRGTCTAANEVAWLTNTDATQSTWHDC